MNLLISKNMVAVLECIPEVFFFFKIWSKPQILGFNFILAAMFLVEYFNENIFKKG